MYLPDFMDQLYLTFNVNFFMCLQLFIHDLMKQLYLKLIVSLFEYDSRYLYKVSRIIIAKNQF